VFERGLGRAPGVVPFPHARRRLDLDDRLRVGLAARRFAPAVCLALDEGQGARRDGDVWRLSGTERVTAPRRLAVDGAVEPWAA
jgi:hypothetical protein